MERCLLCMIRSFCLRFASGALNAPFMQFAPTPALNSFQHPWRVVGGGAISLVGVWGKDYPCRNVLSGQLLDIDFNSTIRHDHKG